MKENSKNKPELKNLDQRGYFIDSAGNVYSDKSGQRVKLKQGDNGYGYNFVRPYEDGKHLTKYVHRLVAETFVPNDDGKPCVNHIDGNKKNNDYTNLEWVTYAENTQHAMSLGINGQTKKLSTRKVRQIRDSIASGEKVRVLARQFNVDPRTIRDVRDRKIWAWL